MKICYLIDAWMPVWGGGQEHVFQVCNRLSKKYDLTLIVPNLADDQNDQFLISNFKILKLGLKFKFPNIFGRMTFAICSLWYVISTNYDLYHSHNYSTSALLILPMLLQSKEVFFTLHGAGVRGLEAEAGSFIVKFVNVTGIARIMQELVLYWWPYKVLMTAAASSVIKKPYFTKDVVVVGNGVNVEEFDKVRKDSGQARMTSRKFRIFWIGRKHDPVKGVKFLEEAVKDLNVELDVAENIYGEEKIKRFKQADLFVLPSLSEGFPIVLLEAMASRVPIVTTDVGDCRKLVEEAKCGLVVPPGDVKALKGAIIKIRKDPKNYGENGYKFVKENYTWDKVASIYNSYYRRLNP